MNPNRNTVNKNKDWTNGFFNISTSCIGARYKIKRYSNKKKPSPSNKKWHLKTKNIQTNDGLKKYHI